MSHYDPNLESEQPLFEKPAYSNISNLSSSTSREMPNGHHHNNHHHPHHNHKHNSRSSTSSNHDHDNNQRTLSPTLGDDMDSPDMKSQQDLQLMLQAQTQAVEARVSKLQSRLLILGGVTVVGFNILIVLCAVFFTKLNYDIAHHTHKPKLGTQMAAILQEGLCVPCEDFRLGPSREEERMLERYKDESSGSGKSAKCCVDKPGDLLELLKLYIERRFRQELAKGTVRLNWPKVIKDTVSGVPVASLPRPAAHFMMPRINRSKIKNVRGRQYEIEEWLYQGDMAFTTGGAYHQHGRIVVPADGFYYVYSQISFLESPPGYGDRDRRYMDGSPSLSVYLYRYNMLYTKGGGEEKLAQNSITRCWGEQKPIEEYTSSLGAVFFLRQKDEIFIKVSNLSLILDDPKSTYFGFFRI